MRRQTSRGRTRRGRTRLRKAALSARARASLKRDALGRVVECEERVLSGEAVTSRYEYDVRGRLVSVTTNGVVSESYAYDANGNRIGGEYNAQDRQLAFGSATYVYDLNGSMTNRNGATLEWNLFGRLVSVGDVFYWRDEQQRLRSKEVEGAPVKDWYWSGSRIVAEYDYASDETSVFVYAAATAPAYMIRGGVTYRIITDNQGSVRLVVDAETGDVMQRLDYDSFGRVLRDTNPGFQPFGFQGGLYDPDTGLVEFGCRWYDAETGRWISKDPIGLCGGFNLYAFCDNDSISFKDPEGLGKVSLLMKTVKGAWKYISRSSAVKKLREGKDVMITMTGEGRSKKAKRILEEAKGKDKKIVRHDGHKPGQATHFQPKQGDGTHIRLPGAHLTSGTFIGEILDFFNPISDVQDVIDMFYGEDDLFPEEDEEYEK